jgi:hypothetical protein
MEQLKKQIFCRFIVVVAPENERFNFFDLKRIDIQLCWQFP